MSPEKWQKIKAVFNEVIELAPEQRETVLASKDGIDAEILAEVRNLLAAEKQDIFENPVADITHLWSEREAEDYLGKQIGKFRIKREIGRGGMGVVYEASREAEDFSQTVALKILKRGMDSDLMLRRFRHERQILASLEHPNIAHLLDGGMTDDGLPFYAMEFVKGQPLDDYCREKNLNISDRLTIFRQVCAAVSFAHSRLVVHRDLKPTNILVTEDGAVKLLDFGIAKILTPENESQNQTVTAFGMMTPAYASPEQIKGETPATSTDIYSLGLILYELLTGFPAYKFPNKRPDQMAKIICEIEPLRPSSAIVSQFPVVSTGSTNVGNEQETSIQSSKLKTQNSKLLRGDLDNIILKALRKEPANRYASVEQFSEDLRRNLEGLPVSARSATLGYRAAKFVGRNRLAVASGSLASLGVIGGIAATFWQSVRANRQKQLAERRFEEVRQLARNVLFKYHDAIADLPGSTAAREMLIKDASEYLDNLARETYDDSELEEELAAAYKKIADVQGRVFQANLGDSRTALDNYRKSHEIYQRLLEKRPNDGEILKSIYLVNENLSLLLVRLADWNEANISAQICFDSTRRLIALEPENLEFQMLFLRSYLALGKTAEFSEGFEEQIKIYRECLKQTEVLLLKNPKNHSVQRLYATLNQRIGTQLEYWCDALRDRKADESEIEPKLTEALNVHIESLRCMSDLVSVAPHNTIALRSEAACLNNVGSALARLGDGADSLKNTSAALEKFYRLSRIDPENKEASRDIADGLQYVAMSFETLGEIENALKNYSDALAHLKPLAEKDVFNYEFVEQTFNLTKKIGDLELKNGDFPRAADFYRDALALVERRIRDSDNDQLRLLRAIALEKLGDVFRWLAMNLSSGKISEKRYFQKQSTDFYRQSLFELRNLKRTNRLTQTYAYKINLVEKKLANFDF